jgi:hypothetical protein
MSLRDRLDHARLEAARDAAARTVVLHTYAGAAQAHDHHAELAHLFDQPGSRMSFEWAAGLALRAWQAERDDPEPGL